MDYNQLAEDYVLKFELGSADQDVRSVSYLCDDPRIYCTNITGSYSGVLAKDHNAGGAIDFVFQDSGHADEVKGYLRRIGFACEYHQNYSSKVAFSYSVGKTHLHCTSPGFINKKLAEIGDIYFTSYNPEAGQTDSTPCFAGGTQFDICEMAKGGERPIAFSQDLVSWTGRGILSAGTRVSLSSSDYPDDPRCNGEFVVSDSMNARFTKRGDIFFMERKNNTSCNAKVQILTP